MKAPLVLIVDDEENIRVVLRAMLEAESFIVHTAANLTEAKAAIQKIPFEVIVTDLKLDQEDGISLLKWLNDERRSVPIVFLTAHGTIDSAVVAMKQGAFDYLSKPFERVDLVATLRKAVLTYQYHVSLPSSPTAASLDGTMIGTNERMLRLYQLVDRVAKVDSTVLITGESGTGKELVAQAIHDRSRRSANSLIKINCAAIPETLLESEMFGHERGAFTGAVNSKPGRFELADKGTLFLDEIAEMSTEMQVKLLRVLQDRRFERVGGLRTLEVDVRLVAATNRDLEAEVKAGRFRRDLFYRLNVVPISLPPLRERPDDIPRLVRHFVEKFSQRLGKPAPTLAAETLELLVQFPWPGNIRQLENVLERLVVMAENTSRLLPEHLPEEIIDFEEERFFSGIGEQGSSLRDRVRDATRRIEKKAIEEALAETHHNVTQAARFLNISRKGLQLKMKELGLRG